MERKLTEKEKKKLEDDHLETGDLHKTAKREVVVMMKPFMLANFESHEHIMRKQRSMEQAIGGAMPNSFLRMMDSMTTKLIAIVALVVAIVALQRCSPNRTYPYEETDHSVNVQQYRTAESAWTTYSQEGIQTLETVRDKADRGEVRRR